MDEWIEYTGENKPDDNELVRVKFPDGWESDPDDFEPAGRWAWDFGEDPNLISHFIREKSQ